MIDIGTNTINLLIVSPEVDGFKTEFFDRDPAKLGEGGMMTSTLTEAAMGRGINALAKHKQMCKQWGVGQSDIKVTATSAVRSARNREAFVSQVLDETGLEIEVIDGQREAELIWKGVRYTGLLDKGPALIMDIGGGSTEFIIAEANQVRWMKSYDLGVTRIKEYFKANDPFTEADEVHMQARLEAALSELRHEIKAYPVKSLIGASGSFNSVVLMLAEGDRESLLSVQNEIPMTDYQALSLKLRRTGMSERAVIPGLIPDRVDTMPYAVLLIDYVTESLGLEKMWRSSYALKEGLVSEMV